MHIANWPATRERLERLCRLVAGDDLAGMPVYIVDYAELRDDRLSGGQCNAWTCELCDLILSPWLTSQGRWQGRGFATVVHVDKIPDLLFLTGAVLHELAHFVSLSIPFDVAEFGETPQSLGTLWLAREPADVKLPDGAPRWQGHGSDFVRASCHVAFRANLCLESLRPQHLRFASPYFGSATPGQSEREFMTSLESELDSRQSEPIRSILATEPPAEFIWYWHLLTDWWYELQAEKETANALSTSR